MDEIEKNNGEIIIYRTEDGRTQLEVRLENENVWLSQQQSLLTIWNAPDCLHMNQMSVRY